MAAAKAVLLETGFAKLSTRRIADEAGVPQSQINYHFGSKQLLIHALLADENERLLDRQREMFGRDVPLWKRYEMACDFFDDDLESGYVRVVNEMIAVGYADEAVAELVRHDLDGWLETLVEVAGEAADRLGGLGPFTVEDVANLVACAFAGAEHLILIGQDRRAITGALRRIGEVIRHAEEAEER